MCILICSEQLPGSLCMFAFDTACYQFQNLLVLTFVLREVRRSWVTTRISYDIPSVI